MKKLGLILASASLMATMFTGCNTQNPTAASNDLAPTAILRNNVTLAELAPKNGTPIEGQYIVVFNENRVPRRSGKGFVSEKARKLLRERGMNDQSVEKVYDNALSGFCAKVSKAEMEKLKEDPSVLFIEQDRIVTIEGGKKRDVTPPPEQQITPWGISRVGGFVDATNLGRTAWIIDTGVDQDHPDLNVAESNNISFVPRDSNPDDKHGHGTHVAGIIAAKNNSQDVVGVAAGAPVVSVRVLDRRGSGAMSDVLAGVNYVASRAQVGDVANMSLGGGVYDALDLAVTNAGQAGIKFVLAAGNESMDASLTSPARANGENVFTVSAIDEADALAYFSNYGLGVDYAAPGVNILSLQKGGGTTTMSGTSMAAPHVTGLLLLGPIVTDGFISGDKDNVADPIAHR